MELTVIKHHHPNFQTPSCSEKCVYRSKIREITSPVSIDALLVVVFFVIGDERGRN